MEKKEENVENYKLNLNKIQDSIEKCQKLIKSKKISKHFINIIFSNLLNFMICYIKPQKVSLNTIFNSKYEKPNIEANKIIESIYTHLLNLSEQNFFNNIGNNFPFFNILDQIAIKINKLHEIAIQTDESSNKNFEKFEISIDYVHKIDFFSSNIQKILKPDSKINSFVVKHGGELLKIFWAKYFEEELIISTTEFISNFQLFIKETEDIKLNKESIVKIRTMIDEEEINSINAEKINEFFNILWCDNNKKNFILHKVNNGNIEEDIIEDTIKKQFKEDDDILVIENPEVILSYIKIK